MYLQAYADDNVTSHFMSHGRAMAQAVSRRPLTAEAWVQSRFSPCGVCGGQSGTGTGFPPENFGFPLSISFHRCSITRINKKKIIIFIIGLHNKPQGCGASVASAAGPFTTKKNFTSQGPPLQAVTFKQSAILLPVSKENTARTYYR
jgi:hypothetical protein